MKKFLINPKYFGLVAIFALGLFSNVLIANAVPTDCSTDLNAPGTYTLGANTSNTCNITSTGVTLDGGGFTVGGAPGTSFAYPEAVIWFKAENDTVESVSSTDTAVQYDSVGYVPGVVGSAFDFKHEATGSASPDGFLVGNSNKDFSAALSVGGWYYLSSAMVTGAYDSAWVLSYGDENSGSWDVRLDEIGTPANTNLIFGVLTNSGWQYDNASTAVIPRDTWFHFMWTYEAGAAEPLKLYINGVPDVINFNTGAIDNGGIIPNGADNLYINSLTGRAWGGEGKLDELTVYERPLSQAEVEYIYSIQASGAGGGSAMTGNGNSFDISNLNTTGLIISAGATINIANSTVATVNVSGANAVGDGQAGGIVNLTSNTTAGALIANGGNSTDTGLGGAAGSFSIDGTSSATSQTAADGACGPNSLACPNIFTGAAADEYWDNPANWSKGTVPGPTDNVLIQANVSSDYYQTYLNSVTVNSAIFSNGAVFDSQGYGFSLNATAITFEDTSSNMYGSLVGAVTFNTSSHNDYGYISGEATLNADSYNSGTLGSTAIFNGNSTNYGTVSGVATFNGNSHNEANVDNDATINTTWYNNGLDSAVGGVLTVSSFQYYAGYISGIMYGSDSSQVTSNLFKDDSYNTGTTYFDSVFNDRSYNSGTLGGSTNTFNGDSTELSYGSGSGLTRYYTTNPSTARNFVAAGLSWIVVADAVVVDLSAATCGPTTTFLPTNVGSFIYGATCTAGPSDISIVAPLANATLTSLSPVTINWNQGIGGYNYSSCQYSFGDISDWNGVSDWTSGALWTGVSCTGTGAEVRATSTYYGTQILAIRAFYNRATTTDIVTDTVSFTYAPSRFMYFYNDGSDPSWSTVGNWYTDVAHTVPAGSLPTSLDKVTVKGTTAPTVDLDTWTQPSSLNSGTVGVSFTSASNASTTVRITGNAIFNDTAGNKGTITGNAVFNDTSSNITSGGSVSLNATFNASSTNAGIVSLNGTFYGEGTENTGTVSGIKTRYYSATTTATRSFTNSWTVVADGVAVTIASSTQYNATTKFRTINSGYFIGGPEAVYFYSTAEMFSSWTSTSNWYSNSTHTTALGHLPYSTSTIITLGSVAPTVNLDSASWVTPSGIDASQTGISFTSSASASVETGITGTTTFNGNAINLSTISGDVTFASSTRNNSGAVITGDVTFDTNSINNGGLINGDVTFNSSSYNTNGSIIFGTSTFNGASYNDTTAGTISGNTIFTSTSHNDGTIDNDAVFYEDATENNGTVSGTQTRYFTAVATTTRNFVTTGPWTLVADGVTVHLDDATSFNATTTFSEINGGNFTGEGVPGSYTTCSKSLMLLGTYTLEADTTNVCDIQSSGVIIEGGNNLIGTPPPQAFPDNQAVGWTDMTGNVLLMHMDESSGNIIDTSGNGEVGTPGGGGLSYNQEGDIGSGIDFNANSRVNVSTMSGVVGSEDYTISAWIKMDGYASSYDNTIFTDTDWTNIGGWSRFIFSEDTSFGHTLSVQYYCSMTGVQNGNSYNPHVNGNTALGLNTWYHVVYVHSLLHSDLYLDGQLDGSQDFVYNGAPSTQHCEFSSFGKAIGGGFQGSSRNFNGKIDEFAIWNSALSSQDVLDIYNAQVSVAGTVITGNGYNFDLNNVRVNGTIISVGATINIANSTVSTVNVSGANAVGDGQAGGTINLTTTIAGALTANGGNSTDYGYGGAAGTISPMTNINGSSATSRTANAGTDGPNLRAGQAAGGSSSSSVSGCMDPSASNYNSNANVDSGSCRYATPVVQGCTNPSATNYNANATVSDGSCTYSVYNPYVAPGSGGDGGDGGNSGGDIPTVTLSLASTGGTLRLHPLPVFDINANTHLGDTVLGNLLEGLKPLGALQFNLVGFNLDLPISNFLFAPLPRSVTDALNKSSKLASVVSAVGINRAQDIAILHNSPMKLPPSGDDVPGLFIVSSGTTTLDNYIASDEKHGLMQLVYTQPGTVLNVSLIPLSSGKVIGKFGDEEVIFFQSPKSAVNAVITASTTPGRYFLETKSAPLSLVVEVLAPPPPPPTKPSGFWSRVGSWFGRLFHR